MKITITCQVCGKEVERSKSEVNRSQRLGRKLYCSRRCVGLDTFDNIPLEKRSHPENVKPGREVDELSPFRWHFRRISDHSERKGKSDQIEITLEDLKTQWEKQNGICPYTGWKLVQLKSTSDQMPQTPNRSSVDRIDSSKGYTKDNIQFVSLMAQYAKNQFHESELIEFCRSVTEHHQST